jgi:hypothetical protein
VELLRLVAPEDANHVRADLEEAVDEAAADRPRATGDENPPTSKLVIVDRASLPSRRSRGTD